MASDFQFERTASQVKRGYKLARASVAALDKGLARTPGYHVGKGGEGPSAIKGRYAEARAFLARARADGTKIHAPEGGVDKAGNPFLDDGRHRFAALRDSGARTVEIAIPRGQVPRFERLFGAGEKPPVPPAAPAKSGGGEYRPKSLNQPLAGRVEPGTATWKTASPALRRQFYAEAGKRAVEEKRAELTRAIGANGRTMKPRKRPRPDGANGPVLTPHDRASRASRLMAARAWDGGVTLFWHSGIGKGQARPWGVILGYHAGGKVPGAPKRDVRLSTRGINRVRAAMAKWWTAHARKATLAAKAREARAGASAPPKGIVGKVKAAAKKALSAAEEAMARRYPYLRKHFRPPGEGI